MTNSESLIKIEPAFEQSVFDSEDNDACSPYVPQSPEFQTTKQEDFVLGFDEKPIMTPIIILNNQQQQQHPIRYVRQKRSLPMCFQCDKCKKFLDSKSQLSLHRTVHHPQLGCRPNKTDVKYSTIHNKCPICHRSFVSLGSLNRHQNLIHKPIATGSRTAHEIEVDFFKSFGSSPPSSKSILPKKLPRTVSQSVHKSTKAGEAKNNVAEKPKKKQKTKRRLKRLFCALCGEKYIENTTHDKTCPFETLLCNCCKTFSSRQDGLNHIKSCQKGISQARICALLCDIIFPDARKFRIHGYRVHGPVKCTHCSKRFSCPERLELHLKLVKEYYHCSVCPARFRKQTCLAHHNRLHTKQRFYKCEECLQEFIWQSALFRHQRMARHCGREPFMCDRCARPFSDSGNLERHQRSGCGTKSSNQVVCDICDKVFRRKDKLARHLLRVHR